MRRAASITHVKVLFYVDEDDGTCQVESMWAVPEADGYRIDNIPFLAAPGDGLHLRVGSPVDRRGHPAGGGVRAGARVPRAG